MPYHYLHIWSIECFDQDTKITTKENGESILENLGVVIDLKTADPMFELMGHFFVEDILKEKLTDFPDAKLSFTEVTRIVKGANWMENYPTEEPPKIWKVSFDGVVGQDPFGLSNLFYLVVSETALHFLRDNGVTAAESDAIEVSLEDYFTSARRLFWVNAPLPRAQKSPVL